MLRPPYIFFFGGRHIKWVYGGPHIIEQDKSWLNLFNTFYAEPIGFRKKTKEGERRDEFHVVGIENNETPSTLSVWPNDHGEDYRSTVWPFKVIRHVFGFGIEFLENKYIGIIGNFIEIYFNTRYSCHTYFSSISTSWYRRFGNGCIVCNGEWHIFVNHSLFLALISLKLRLLFEEGILGTPVQKDTVPPMVISNYHRWKPNSTNPDLGIELSLFTSHWSTVWNIIQVVSVQYQRQTSIKLFNQIDFVLTLSFKV